MVNFYSVIPTFLGILLVVLQTKADSPSELLKCADLLKNFADVVSNFTFCAVSNSRPFRFCCHCKHEYIAAINGHRGILIHPECHKDLVLAEKHQLVESAFQFVEDLWKDSNCPGE